jgi:tetratricopeptide (TPR) repeat protein
MIRIVFTFILSLGLQFAFAQDAEQYFKTGDQKLRQGDNEAALLWFNKAVEADPSNANYYLQRAFVNNVLEHYEAAIKDYDKVLEMHPNNVFAYVSRGSCKNKLEKFEDAMFDFNKALSLDEDNQEAYNNRGWAKQGLGDKKGACQDWKTSRKKGNEEAKIILKNTHCK